MELTMISKLSIGQGKPPHQSSIGYKDSKTQSTYYGFGRQGTDSLKGSKTQVIWSSPVFPNLTGKTRLYKSYNINS